MNLISRNVKWSAYLCFGQAALYVLTVCVLTLFLGTMLNAATQTSGSNSGKIALTSAGLILVVFCLGIPIIIAFGLTGIGLLQQWAWAKWAAILMSALDALLAFPLGTLLGVPVIILLLRPDPKPVSDNTFPADTSLIS